MDANDLTPVVATYRVSFKIEREAVRELQTTSLKFYNL